MVLFAVLGKVLVLSKISLLLMRTEIKVISFCSVEIARLQGELTFFTT